MPLCNHRLGWLWSDWVAGHGPGQGGRLQMLLGIVSDVHCDASLLEVAAAEMAAAGATEMLLAGDAHYEYRFSNDVTEVIRAYGMRYIAGNHELRLMGPD